MKVCDFPAGIAEMDDCNSAGWAAKMTQQEILMHQQAAAGAPSIVPAFLGLVTEPSRGVIGFLSQFIDNAVTLDSVPHVNSTLNDMVRRAVEKLHNEARVAHNDLHKENMLVKRDGSGVFIIDFEHAVDLRVRGLDLASSIASDNLIWTRFSGLLTP
ncbi:hypothetical protein PG994_006250 [Apiospora phragmitis]|uniref:non-specific serine/threonine protein kinase n=1 Tax=Apiospora phragmitis TaxID=2905665 RepID=A0ABR1VI24_9PEZI